MAKHIITKEYIQGGQKPDCKHQGEPCPSLYPTSIALREEG